MVISLIGFSGTGKSHWARRLGSEFGFVTYCCDDLIESKLKAAGIFSGQGISNVGRWMGMPFDEGFAKKEQQYLNFEIEVMDEIFESLAKTPPTRPVVIDTTGSVIYTGEQRCRRLQEISKVVYLDVDNEKIEQMQANYIAKPKPVLWNKMFRQLAGESQSDALKRSYRELLLSRAERYNVYAEITIPFAIHKQKKISTREFLELISNDTK